MSRTFLLEIGLEEMPAHVVTPSVNQLADKTAAYLKDQRISYDQIKKFSTPRRLAIQITGLVDKQPDVDEEVKGPAEKIVKDKNGDWSKAAIGFTKGQGLSPADIVFKDVKGTKYAFVKKHIEGKPVQVVLSGLSNVVKSMTFPTLMKWGTNKFEFIRPIKWIVALLDDEVIPMQIVDVHSGRTTWGHRFLGKDVELKNAKDYEEALTNQHVIADTDKRKDLIRKQIEAIAKKHNWKINIDSDLLEEVNNLVEWPTSFAGKFDDHFLKIPREVLITSMRNHQRFFYVEDQDGNLLPYFVSVRNGDENHLDNVIAGNEKVLTARLDDADFFYNEDQQQTIDDYVNKLKTVSFHDKISSEYDKMQRVQVIAKLIGEEVGLDEKQLKHLQRAAEIYKFDLVTGMVGEFAELQGVMGEKYALLAGEDPEVATAIREHYLPISADGQLPKTKVGAVLSVADKLDSVMTFFAAGMVPNGSNDPYALRRQAAGIVRIVTNEKWRMPLVSLMKNAIAQEKQADVLPKVDQNPIVSDVVSFIKERIKRQLKSQDIRYDLIDAAVGSTDSDIYFNVETAMTLNDHKDDAHFKEAIESLTRVVRIAQKGNFKDGLLEVDPNMFENDSERILNEQVDRISQNFDELNANQTFEELTSLRPAINDYFDQTMVMVDDEKVRTNRLAELTNLARLIDRFAAVDEIIVK
ncbi:glycyl-tRNA synthetase subunit beta [Fructilactobacillus fructivorans]|uniref:glycine--tRNA ligase subunit beta n=1 Tax=Fructilactobacillus fructivorans TaxID=1614 RepID=UPI000704A266|nr:glycine--tRNA ligase subunit beta [Fructilactobacillus fructivorans]KRN13602.1 glycyl-tRNA synthetase subunit beta [Fructilactobacillus fructivorans]